jgi:manganese transport protein
MNMLSPALRNFLSKSPSKTRALEFLKFVGPGLLVTVGFIDPGNWASNIAAGSRFGYALLWTISLSTVMLIFLQHNAAHLGIATGLCLAEACNRHYPVWLSRGFLSTGLCAVIATAFAEVLGAAIGLNMLFGLPLPIGAGLTVVIVLYFLFSTGYRRLERWIIAFVSLIGLSFLFELSLTEVGWRATAQGWLRPSLPSGSLPIVMSVLGAVVMPHNIFLHSEVIQSRQWNLRDEATIHRQLKFEFADTLLAMCVGWAINSAMIVVAAAVFFSHGTMVTELQQAQATLKPLLGAAAAAVFALALVGAGFASSVTAAVAAGSVSAGIFGHPLNLSEKHSRIGVISSLVGALVIIFLVSDAYSWLIWSQIALSIQLPFTVFSLIFLTSSRKVMGRFANRVWDKILLGVIAGIVTLFNIMLLVQSFGS